MINIDVLKLVLHFGFLTTKTISHVQETNTSKILPVSFFATIFKYA